jgi:hypothetical protein
LNRLAKQLQQTMEDSRTKTASLEEETKSKLQEAQNSYSLNTLKDYSRKHEQAKKQLQTTYLNNLNKYSNSNVFPRVLARFQQSIKRMDTAYAVEMNNLLLSSSSSSIRSEDDHMDDVYSEELARAKTFIELQDNSFETSNLSSPQHNSKIVTIIEYAIQEQQQQLQSLQSRIKQYSDTHSDQLLLSVATQLQELHREETTSVRNQIADILVTIQKDSSSEHFPVKTILAARESQITSLVDTFSYILTEVLKRKSTVVDQSEFLISYSPSSKDRNFRRDEFDKTLLTKLTKRIQKLKDTTQQYSSTYTPSTPHNTSTSSSPKLKIEIPSRNTSSLIKEAMDDLKIQIKIIHKQFIHAVEENKRMKTEIHSVNSKQRDDVVTTPKGSVGGYMYSSSGTKVLVDSAFQKRQNKRYKDLTYSLKDILALTSISDIVPYVKKLFKQHEQMFKVCHYY